MGEIRLCSAVCQKKGCAVQRVATMATFTSTTAPISSSSSSTSFLRSSSIHHQNHQFSLLHNQNHTTKTFHKKKQSTLTVQAAKLPAGVELPKVQPKFEPPFLGFTRTAETWNSRACMIGLIGTFIVELIINKGILQVIGVDIGKGLDLPL